MEALSFNTGDEKKSRLQWGWSTYLFCILGIILDFGQIMMNSRLIPAGKTG